MYKIKEIGYLQKAMDMRLARQNAIHSNVANISTPGY
jgi:flagellar basal body rod protein FlgB